VVYFGDSSGRFGNFVEAAVSLFGECEDECGKVELSFSLPSLSSSHSFFSLPLSLTLFFLFFCYSSPREK